LACAQEGSVLAAMLQYRRAAACCVGRTSGMVILGGLCGKSITSLETNCEDDLAFFEDFLCMVRSLASKYVGESNNSPNYGWHASLNDPLIYKAIGQEATRNWKIARVPPCRRMTCITGTTIYQ